jgi:hypothetical protein
LNDFLMHFSLVRNILGYSITQFKIFFSRVFTWMIVKAIIDSLL